MVSVPLKMTEEEKALVKEWNKRLKDEGLAMSRGLPPKSITLVHYLEELGEHNHEEWDEPA